MSFETEHNLLIFSGVIENEESVVLNLSFILKCFSIATTPKGIHEIEEYISFV